MNQSQTSQPLYLHKNYQEVVTLLQEAQGFLSLWHRRARRTQNPLTRLTVSYVSMRMVARLTQCAAWLLAQRAMQVGEVNRNSFLLRDSVTAEKEIFQSRDWEKGAHIPGPLQALLKRSADMYDRILRLEHLASNPDIATFVPAYQANTALMGETLENRLKTIH